jgi:hypothetical protein
MVKDSLGCFLKYMCRMLDSALPENSPDPGHRVRAHRESDALRRDAALHALLLSVIRI